MHGLQRRVVHQTEGQVYTAFAWARIPDIALICDNCGYVHVFAADVGLWSPDWGYPRQHH
jgi:hypothetical protein